MKNMLNVVKSSVILFGMLLSLGCGGGGTTSEDKTFGTGYYIDSAVVGVSYTCGSKEGTTGQNGEFTFEEGASCTFSLGDITLRAVESLMLEDGIKIIEDDIKVARFLQTMDKDGDPSNGIEIPSTIITAMHDAGIKTLPQDDADIDAVYNAIKEVSEYTGRAKTTEEAQMHLDDTITQNNAISFSPPEVYYKPNVYSWSDSEDVKQYHYEYDTISLSSDNTISVVVKELGDSDFEIQDTSADDSKFKFVNGQWVEDLNTDTTFTLSSDNKKLTLAAWDMDLYKQSMIDISDQSIALYETDEMVTMPSGAKKILFKIVNIIDSYNLYGAADDGAYSSVESVLEDKCGSRYFIDAKNSSEAIGIAFTCGQEGQSNGTLVGVKSDNSLISDAGTWEIKNLPNSTTPALLVSIKPEYNEHSDNPMFAIKDGSVYSGEWKKSGVSEIEAWYNEIAMEAIKSKMKSLGSQLEDPEPVVQSFKFSTPTDFNVDSRPNVDVSTFLDGYDGELLGRISLRISGGADKEFFELYDYGGGGGTLEALNRSIPVQGDNIINQIVLDRILPYQGDSNQDNIFEVEIEATDNVTQEKITQLVKLHVSALTIKDLALSIPENIADDVYIDTLTINMSTGQTITSMILTGDGAEDFKIVDKEIQVASSLDYDTRSTYNLKVSVTTNQGEEAEADVLIRISEAEQAELRFYSATDFNVDSRPSVRVGALLDGYDGENYLRVSLRISGGADQELFDLYEDGNSGTLVVLNTTLPYQGDSNQDNIFEVEIEATDNLTQEKITQLVKLHVSALTIEDLELSIPENTANDVGIGGLPIRMSSGQTITSRILTGDGAEDFKLVDNQIQVASSLDYDTKSTYNLKVSVTTNQGEEAEADVLIRISEAEQVELRFYSATDFNVDSSPEVRVGAFLDGYDGDIYLRVSLRISGGADQELFDLYEDGNSGTLVALNTTLPYQGDSNQDNIFEVEIEATDNLTQEKITQLVKLHLQ